MKPVNTLISETNSHSKRTRTFVAGCFLATVLSGMASCASSKSAEPDLFTALGQSLGTILAVLFLAGTFATKTGLGYLIIDATEQLVCPWHEYRI